MINSEIVEQKFHVTYVLSSNLKELITCTFILHPLFDGLEGKYTLDELVKIVKFIHSYNCPDFNENISGWDDFAIKLNKEIYNIYGK